MRQMQGQHIQSRVEKSIWMHQLFLHGNYGFVYLVELVQKRGRPHEWHFFIVNFEWSRRIVQPIFHTCRFEYLSRTLSGTLLSWIRTFRTPNRSPKEYVWTPSVVRSFTAPFRIVATPTFIIGNCRISSEVIKSLLTAVIFVTLSDTCRRRVGRAQETTLPT